MSELDTPPDRLRSLLERFQIRARLFHQGPLCGVTTFAARPGRGFLHVLRQGEMAVTHREPDGALIRADVTQPSLLFYPSPLEHAFHNAPTEDSDFACASLDVAEGLAHPLLRVLPPVIIVPLAAVPTLRPSLQLLFSEVDQGLCGDGLVIDRLFEVVLIQLFRWLLAHAEALGIPEGLIVGLSDPAIARALTAVHEHPANDWMLESLAAEARMGRSSFAKRFVEVVGQTPAEYVAEWRMLVAQQLLRSGESVGQVAIDVGYATAPAFSRAFTRRVGISPRVWADTSARG